MRRVPWPPNHIQRSQEVFAALESTAVCLVLESKTVALEPTIPTQDGRAATTAPLANCVPRKQAEERLLSRAQSANGAQPSRLLSPTKPTIVQLEPSEVFSTQELKLVASSAQSGTTALAVVLARLDCAMRASSVLKEAHNKMAT